MPLARCLRVPRGARTMAVPLLLLLLVVPLVPLLLTKELSRRVVFPGSGPLAHTEGQGGDRLSVAPFGGGGIEYLDVPWTSDPPPQPVNVFSPEGGSEKSVVKGDALKSALDTPTTSCRRLLNLGGRLGRYNCSSCHSCSIDGDKDVCFDEDVRPRPKDCIVYSFGIAKELSFDKAMNLYNCRVFAFDMSTADWTHMHVMNDLHYLSLGLGQDDEVVKYKYAYNTTGMHLASRATLRSLASLREILDHSHRAIDILKVDIENSEWEVLENLLDLPEEEEEEAPGLRGVKQIAIELHLEDLNEVTLEEQEKAAQRLQAILTKLKRRHFHLAATRLNTVSQKYVLVGDTILPLYRESLYLYRPPR
ncbi:uncharacterized protein LOC143028187 isoform X1 [Oratosquilla oratoria]|uniref:uncharacterized protein LOC143028187 isoform X1 n=1 Tax=Oratosquilla oratoria TaxID=337810 RepID=UPI003F75D021